ncbi:hypothetical protein EP837_03850 (plasmid) [Sphingobium sp. EP60837]|nr:hypothetical protein EP837_03850 [Sphingobium sp. EP60837]
MTSEMPDGSRPTSRRSCLGVASAIPRSGGLRIKACIDQESTIARAHKPHEIVERHSAIMIITINEFVRCNLPFIDSISQRENLILRKVRHSCHAIWPTLSPRSSPARGVGSVSFHRESARNVSPMTLNGKSIIIF